MENRLTVPKIVPLVLQKFYKKLDRLPLDGVMQAYK